MVLSETTEARKWLAQFADFDQEDARTLLDDLIIISAEQFTSGIRELIAGALAKNGGFTAIYPIWEVEKSIKGLPRGLSSKPESLFPEWKVQESQAPASRHKAGGSVGRIDHEISDIAKQYGSSVLHTPSLADLRQTKCHDIVLVDDIIGSGERVVDYLEAFYRHKTIKSWCSYPGLRITVVAFAASEHGVKRVMTPSHRYEVARPPSVNVVFHQPLYRGRTHWNQGVRKRLVRLCEDYGKMSGAPEHSLGFDGAFSMIAFPYSIPDTAPSILWAPSNRWNALFPNRAVPGSMVASFSEIRRGPVSQSLRETVILIRDKRQAGEDWYLCVTPRYRSLILFLSVVALGWRRTERISDIMGMSQFAVMRLIVEARRLRLLTWDGSLTVAGRRELRYARSLRAEIGDIPALDTKRPYFPKSLKVRQV